ncbi:MAG TPA: hypothetical protein VLG25_02935 [Patescibacteria group bacterium]|nr:hypothetical protein [Patescibacteria group bacterium]
MSDIEREPGGQENQPSPEELSELRESVLLWADERKRDAHGLESRAIGIAKERYTAGTEIDVPFLSERIRITPIERMKNFDDLFLYFPYDNLNSDQDIQGASPIIFIQLVSSEDATMRYVISRHKTSVFLPKDDMHVALEHFESDLTEIGVEDAFIEGGRQIKSDYERKTLDQLLSYLQDKNSYRITSQPEANAA